MKKILSKDGYTFLRGATLGDLDLLYRWTNDPDVRKNSFTSREITYDEHKDWYNRVLEDTNIVIFILVSGDKDIGQIRITIEGTEAEIGYSIASEYRNMGYGKKIIELLKEKIVVDYPYIQKLIARIKPNNVASKKALTDNCFVATLTEFELSLNIPAEQELNIKIDDV